MGKSLRIFHAMSYRKTCLLMREGPGSQSPLADFGLLHRINTFSDAFFHNFNTISRYIMICDLRTENSENEKRQGGRKKRKHNRVSMTRVIGYKTADG